MPLLYQSGYLTIKGYDKEFHSYKLGFPNEEVENGFVNYLVPMYSPMEKAQTAFFVQQIIREIRNGDVEGFMTRLQTLFADNSYQVQGKMELYFQNTMYVIFKMLGFYVDIERTTSRGRIDMVITTANYVYVIEIKLDGSAINALKQIDTKGYAEPFMEDARTLYKIGVNFSSDIRGISEWLKG